MLTWIQRLRFGRCSYRMALAVLTNFERTILLDDEGSLPNFKFINGALPECLPPSFFPKGL
jgi:hypothetical protein